MLDNFASHTLEYKKDAAQYEGKRIYFEKTMQVLR
jgi:hypothetical protein